MVGEYPSARRVGDLSLPAEPVVGVGHSRRAVVVRDPLQLAGIVIGVFRLDLIGIAPFSGPRGQLAVGVAGILDA